MTTLRSGMRRRAAFAALTVTALSAATILLAVVVQGPGRAGSPAAAESDPAKSGSWFKVAKGPNRPPPAVKAELEKLATVGYLAGYKTAPAATGVTVWDPERAFPGYNLVVSGDAPEAILTDLHGRVLHRWRHEAPAEYGVAPDRNFWRRVRLLDDGSLLAIFDPYGLIKLDRDSNLVWATDGSTPIHHDLTVTADGLIYTLGKRYRKIPRLSDRLTFGEDLIVVLSPDGEVLKQVSIFEAFENSPFAAAVEASIRASTANATGNAWEDFHANTIEVLDGSQEALSPLFKAGNVVSCSPHNDNVFIVDPDAGTVVWNWFGPWLRIHEPRILPGGRLLLFHNNGYRPDVPTLSQALEYDLASRELVWSYDGNPDDLSSRFFSGTSGTVERLPNGNTLIVVTESGRAIEVTRSGQVVWEFWNPKRAGEKGELIASLFQLQRVGRESVDRWLGSSSRADRPAPAPSSG